MTLTELKTQLSEAIKDVAVVNALWPIVENAFAQHQAEVEAEKAEALALRDAEATKAAALAAELAEMKKPEIDKRNEQLQAQIEASQAELAKLG